VLELACTGGAVSRVPQPTGRVHHIEKCRSFRTQSPAVDRMIRIALDVDDVGGGVLRTVAEAINENTAGDRAIGAGVAGLGRSGELERSDGSGQGLPG